MHNSNYAHHLTNARKELGEAVDKLVEENNLSDNLEAISMSSFTHFQYLIDADPGREIDKNKTFVVTESALNYLYYTFRLMIHLTRIYECQDSIISLVRSMPDEKEVSNG